MVGGRGIGGNGETGEEFALAIRRHLAQAVGVIAGAERRVIPIELDGGIGRPAFALHLHSVTAIAWPLGGTER